MQLVSHARPHLQTSHALQHVAFILFFLYLHLFSSLLTRTHFPIKKQIIKLIISHTTLPMADRDRDRIQPHQIQVHPTAHHRYEGGMKNIFPQKGPSAAQILAILTLLPVGGSLLGLAGITLVGTLIGLAVAIPIFVIFSPVLVPAAILLAGAVTGFLTSGAFGLTGLSSFSWVFNSFRQATGQEPLEYARRRVADATIQVGEKTKQAGEYMGEKTKQTGESIKPTRGTEGATART